MEFRIDRFNAGNRYTGDALAQIEVIVLGTAAVTGILLCLLGLKIVRVWAALTGLASGFTAELQQARCWD